MNRPTNTEVRRALAGIEAHERIENQWKELARIQEDTAEYLRSELRKKDRKIYALKALLISMVSATAGICIAEVVVWLTR